jgi:nucleoside-diphosphate-sugar epimerase
VKKVLITGASGFIGRHCLPLLLDRGYEVHAIARHPLVTPNLDLHWHQADIFDLQAIQKLIAEVRPSHLLHLAWYAVPGKYWTAMENFQWVAASLDLVRIFQEHGGSRITVAGTCAEYDWQYGYCNEWIGVDPQSPYGVCKHSLHQLLESFCQQSELSMAWGRIFWLYGVFEAPNRLISSVIRSLLENKIAKCSSGEQIRDFLYVEDVADALVTVLDSEIKGSINIASGEPISIKNIVKPIGRLLNKIENIEFGTSNQESPLVVANVRKLKYELKWQPKFTLETGISATINFWKQEILK